MNHKKAVKNKTKKAKMITLLASLACILLVSISGTLAYLFDETDPVKNTLEPGKVPPSVVEEIEGEVKKTVQIKNEGNVSAYIRAAVIVTWKDEEGNVCGKVPVRDTDYSMKIPDNDLWKKGNYGYYYYTEVVPAGGLTENLLTDGKLEGHAEIPEGYHLSIEIIAQTIQADGQDDRGEKPVILAWGTDYGGSVKAVNPDTTLEIDEAD